jgi:hypothetical protein
MLQLNLATLELLGGLGTHLATAPYFMSRPGQCQP